MKKRLLSILLTACLLMGLLPTAALAADNVSYLDVEGKTQTCSSATEVASGDPTWGDDVNEGWYVVQGSVTISGGVIISGDVCLILADGCTLTIDGSIEGEGNLTIYGQSGGTGRLIVNGSDNTNGDSSYGIKVDSLTINGGSVTVTGGAVTNEDGVATGVSYGIYASSIAISGGTVTATGGAVAAKSYGICAIVNYGNGEYAEGSIVISGGHVTAQASEGFALNTQPVLPATYWWRTGEEEPLTEAADAENGYTHDGYTYVEIRDTAPTYTYTVTLNANGGTVESSALTTGEDGKLTSLPTPTRDGYTFVGWFTADEGGTQVTADTGFTADTTIYAHWTRETYTVTLNANGGTVESSTLTTGENGKLTSLPTPTRDGYTFVGWFTADEGGDHVTTETVFEADATIYAHWTREAYTVTLNANGGTVESSTLTTGGDGTLASLPTPTHDGYTFVGWFTAAEGGDHVTTETVFTENTTIYAHWTRETYSVTVTDGTAEPSGNQAAGTEITITADAKLGYTFKEWTGLDDSAYKSGSSKISNPATFTMPASAVTVAATYAPAALTGTVTISGTTKYGGVLTATVKDSNNTGTLSYQWKRGSSNIGTNSQTYTLVEDDIGSTITVTVTSDIQTGTITSDATSTIAKADGPAAPSVTGVKPSVLGASDGKITGTTAAMEYSTDSGFASSNPCSAGETTGLSAGTYYVRVKATATHEAGAYAAVTVPAGDAALTYSIGLDVSGTHSFDPAVVGYGAQTSKTVTVRNTSTGATGTLSVALSGENADTFTVSKTSISSIAPGGTDSFTVVPNTGLTAGTYTATVTVDGTSVDAKSFVVSFTVSASAAVAPDNYVFNIAEGTIRILDGDTAGKIKVEYGGDPVAAYEVDPATEDGIESEGVRTTPDFAPSQEITVTGSFVISSATNAIGNSLKVETGLPVKIRIKNLTINNHGISDTDGYQAMVLLGSETTGKANVTLTLEGTNYLGGGIACGGIEVGEGHTLTIRGNGSLTAQGYYRKSTFRSGAGIGGHMKSNCGTVNIESGTVTAIGGYGSAGIGGGSAMASVGGNGGTVNISGGKVTATGGVGGAGIGGGSNQLPYAGAGLGGNATITGGTVTATAGVDKETGEYEADAIGGGWDKNKKNRGTGKLTVNGDAWVGWTGTTSTAKTLTQGVVLGVVYGNVTLTENRTLTSGFGVLLIRVNASLTIPEGRTLTMADSVNDIYVRGTLTNYGTLAMNSKSSQINLEDGTLTNYGTLTGAGSITPEEKKLNYAAPPSAPEIVSVSSNSITLKDIPGAEYSKDNGATWQTDPVFSGLTTETEYTFFARYAGNNFYQPSAPNEEGVTQKTSKNAPKPGEGFSIDYARQRITLKDGYEASWTNFGVLVENDALLFLGKNIYIRKAASGNTPASPAMANKIPDRPAAPTGVAYTIDYVNEKLSYDDATYRVYRIIFGEEQTVISGKAFYPGETYYVCTRAVPGQSFESKPAELPLPDRPAAPDSSAFIINFSSEKITFDDSIYEVAEYNRAGITIKPKTILNGDTVTLGKTLRIYKKAVAGESFKSYPLIVDLPDQFDTSSGGGSSSTTTTKKNPDGSTTTTVTDRITGTVTETTRNTDGSTTTVETKKNGTVTETVKTADGTTGTVVTARNGTITEVKASISSSAAKEAFKNHETVTLPVEVPAAGSTKNAPAVDITVPKGTGLVRVEIPVEDVTPGTVAVIVKADGTEEIVSTSMVTENGIALTLTGSTTVKIIDNAKSFTDVSASNVFYSEVCSLSAREIMVGKSEEKFDLYSSVTLNQISNVAGRITGAVDVKDYSGGIAWGQANGLKTGNESATRGDMLKALYNAAGAPAVEDTSSLSKLYDASAIPDDMKTVTAWALQNDILKGTADGKADLSANVTRGQACALAGRTLKTLG